MAGARILAIAALDSSGGAGLNQDIRVCSLLGEEIQCVCSGITIQDENGVLAIHPIPDHVLEAQLESVLSRTELRFVKVGAICNPEQIPLIQSQLKSRADLCLVIDPVLRPSSGLAFISDEHIPQYLELIAMAGFLCPNYPELEALTGFKVEGFDSALLAARKLATRFDLGILVKGGHGGSPQVREAYLSRKESHNFSHPRYSWSYSHGSGCALSSAFTCYLAQGYSPPLAFELASSWVADYFNGINARYVLTQSSS